MAKVEAIEGEKTVVVKAVTGYTLTLTPKEAIALHSLLGGVCDGTDQKFTYKVYEALDIAIPHQFQASGAYEYARLKWAERLLTAIENFEKDNTNIRSKE